jgi:hypothetical protein
MDKRILIGMTLVVMLCAGAWWFVSLRKNPAKSSAQSASVPSQEIVQSPATKLVPTELTAAHSDSDTQRATAAEPAPIAATTPMSDTALVKVLVLDKTTRATMPGVRVTSRDTRTRTGTWGEDQGLSRGKSWDTLRTDAEGRVEITAPPRAELIVSVPAEHLNRGPASMMVAGLEPGTTTEIVLEVPTAVDLPYWIKVVDDTTRAPLIGATVSSKDESEADASVVSNAQGFVFVPAHSSAHILLRVQAPDHTERYVMPARGHEQIEDAVVVELPSSATLRVHVVGADGVGVAAARVVLRATGDHLNYTHDDSSISMFRLPDLRWEGVTDAGGVATLNGLRPRVPIKASIESPMPWTSAQDITLDPGETRDVEWKVTKGCRLHGILIDQTNAPVIARQVSLRKAERQQMAYFLSSPSVEERKTVSDDQGRFDFPAVSAGTWWIGPSPLDRDKRASPDDVAALAQVVEVVDGQDAVDLTLRVDRGLFITGRVLDAKGAPVDHVMLTATDEEARLRVTVQSRDANGEFVIGPLMAGRYSLIANCFGRDASSSSTEVEAGTHDIVLRLRPGGAIAGTVLDDNGQPIPAVVCLSRRDEKFGMTTSPRPNGSFLFQGLEPGTYQLSAHTSDGLIGVLESVESSTDQSAPENVIQLRKGGRIRVRHHGPGNNCYFSVFQNGVELGNDGATLDTTADMVAPVGTVVVRASYYEANRTVERTVEVKAGETVEVVFEKDAH